ncbi:helix-turn-helix domain-containing protein [Microbacterium candidum]|uniref:Helix-turn-helix domain-containing protein n=1 Tax=Microbacterium candidum TaxID=3041922 RepID=A0ABT7N0Z0_9MICO|nr:helix-turn-helix domain-containing protein [Microbacterium sp. ASV49]MDL9980373.1 helix-turn-helix domain-containing protein [Microbacterium sp. ASV49]
MPESSSPARLVPPATVAEALSVSVDEVIELVKAGRLRGARVGSSAQWRIDEASVTEYLDDEIEMTRRMALWEQSNEASFPELWGLGAVRHGD